MATRHTTHLLRVRTKIQLNLKVTAQSLCRRLAEHAAKIIWKYDIFVLT